MNDPFRNQSIDPHCRSIDWFAMTRILVERNSRTETYEKKHPPGHRNYTDR